VLVRSVAFAILILPVVASAQGLAGALNDPETGEPGVRPQSTDGESQDRLQLLVIDAATFGIDPVVGRVASARMRLTAEEMGYSVLTPEQTLEAAQQIRMPYPPTPADLWRVCWVAHVARGAFARVWAHAGQYVIEITVASLDGAGPFFARGTAGADDLREVVDSLLRSALPPSTLWSGPVGGPDQRRDPETPQQSVDELDARPRRRPTPRQPEPELRRFSLVVQTEGAIGAAQDVFYNHLVGARFDVRITSSIIVGAYVAYANLNAREGRAHNILFMGQFEDRIRISPDLDLTIPLRVAAGYLPFNGPVIRLAAGLNYALSPDWEIGADLLVPTFWILPDRTAVSIDFAIEGAVRF
jgi:hypothetical protein